MDVDEIVKHAKRIIDLTEKAGASTSKFIGAKAQACEFLKKYAGPQTSFYQLAKEAGGHPKIACASLNAVLESFIDYLKSGLDTGVSIERKAQLDVVSDFLKQSDELLQNKKVHPAAPAVLIGATLEEFLRTWLENEKISLGNKKPTLDSYCKCLKENDLINKQDVKDITSWAGIRNYAAHGEWENVKDRNVVNLMLQGVNLFIRKYNG